MSLDGRTVPFFLRAWASVAVFRRFRLISRDTRIHPTETTISKTDATVSSGSSSRGWTWSIEVVIWRKT